MTNEALAWPSPPAIADANDDTQAYTMGVRYTSVGGQPCVGIQWRVPDTVATPPGGTHAVLLFELSSGDRIGYQEFVPAPGGYQDVLFSAPASQVDGTDYVASVYTNHYVFRSGSPAGISTPSGFATAVEGRLEGYMGGALTADIPDSTFSAIYYVSPLFEAASAPSEGSFTLGLDLSVDMSGARASAGSFDLGLDLALDLSGTRTSAGSFDVGLRFAADFAGARAAEGLFDLGLNFAAAFGGQTPTSEGSFAVGLGLALSFAGGERSRSDRPYILSSGPGGRIVSTTRNEPREV